MWLGDYMVAYHELYPHSPGVYIQGQRIFVDEIEQEASKAYTGLPF